MHNELVLSQIVSSAANDTLTLKIIPASLETVKHHSNMEQTLVGLVPTFFGIATKQRLLPGYAVEIPVTTAHKISAPCLKLMLTQVTSTGRK